MTSLPAASLKTERVTLGPVRSEDSERLWQWINDRELVLLNAAYQPVPDLSHQQWFSRIVQRSDMVLFGIRENQNDTLIGTCQLHSIHPVHRGAELQIRIGEASQRGKGYGSDAVRLLLDFGFRDLNLHRIYLHVFANNEPAIRAYRKAGFREEGLLRDAAFIDGSYVDVRVMGMLRHERS